MPITIIHKITTGAPGPAMFNRLRQRISQLVRGGRRFYIGITYAPERRAREHESGESDWCEMRLLYQTSKLEGHGSSLRTLERDLIRYYRESGRFITNSGNGGEGRSPEGGPYYLYLLR